MPNLKNIARGIEANADILMTVGSVLGLVITTVLAVKATPRAVESLDRYQAYKERIDKAEIEHDITAFEAELRRREIKKETAGQLIRIYTPTAVALITTGGCIIGTTRYHRVRNAALTSMLNATNLAYSEYREHVREAIGEKKETEVYDQIRKEHIETLPPPKQQEDIYDTGKGTVLCHIEIVPGDPTTGLYFLSSPEAVKSAVNEANAEAIESSYVSMADLLYFMGLKIPGHGSRMFGWQVHSRNDLIQPRYGSYIHDGDSRPVLDIGFFNPPYQGFDRFG